MSETNSIHASHILIVEDDVMLGEMLEEVIGRYHETMLLDRAEHVFDVLQRQSISIPCCNHVVHQCLLHIACSALISSFVQLKTA